MQGQKRDSVINSFPYPKTLGVSQISVCSLQYDTDGMLMLKTSTDQVLQSPSADSRENGRTMHLEPALAAGLTLQFSLVFTLLLIPGEPGPT